MDASAPEIAAEIARRGFERLLLFTDAVVAIAVTLLILPVVDDVLRSNPHATTLALLRQLENELFGFLLSFAVIVVLWLGHQRVFARVAAPSPALVWLNIGWLLTIILLPCTTALIGEHGSEHATLLLYVANVALSLYCLSATPWVLARTPQVLLPGAVITADDRHHALLNGALVTLAFLLALLVPGLGFWVMLLLFLTGPLRRLWARARLPRQLESGGPLA